MNARCTHCKCPLAGVYVTDIGTFCDNICAELEEEEQSSNRLTLADEFPSFLVLAIQ